MGAQRMLRSLFSSPDGLLSRSAMPQQGQAGSGNYPQNGAAGLYLFGHKPETISREITLPALQLSDIKNSGVEFLYLPRMVLP